MPDGLQGGAQGMDIMSLMQGMSEEEQRALMEALGIDYGAESDALSGQLAQADQLRNTPMPEGRQAGNVYQAANPLEFLGAGMQQYQGGQDAQRIEGEMSGVRQQGADNRTQIMQILAGLRNQQGIAGG